jgi:hypothetical protein
VLEIGVALGLAASARRASRLPASCRAGLPALSHWRSVSASGLLPFQAGPRMYASAAAACLFVLTACTLWPPRSRAACARRAGNLALGGLLAALPLGVGQALTRFDYSVTRDERAQVIIDALAEHRARTSTYPDALSELVGADRLPEVPRPRIGFGSREEFTYQNFGESFCSALSPRWISAPTTRPSRRSPARLDAEECRHGQRLSARSRRSSGPW